jgi:GDP-L-fucose synthase
MDQKIFVAGHRGLVGSAIVRALQQAGHQNLVLRTRAELDLCHAEQVVRFMKAERPEIVILAAARVGGIQANIDAPADFLAHNLQIQNNVIDSAARFGTKQLCFLGSSCIYPRLCPQPMKEEYLLTGPVEPTNEGYAIAKIAGLKMAQAYHRQYGLDVVCPMPCNLYGPNESFDLRKSHVLSALVRRFVDARDSGAASITLWGTGTARREFMHADDLAAAILFVMKHWKSPELINVGTGTDVSISELAHSIAEIAGFRGRIEWDSSKPDGMPRKCLDVSKLTQLGFKPKIGLAEGIRAMIAEYCSVKRHINDIKDDVNDSPHEEHVPQRAGDASPAGGVHSGDAAA